MSKIKELYKRNKKEINLVLKGTLAVGVGYGTLDSFAKSISGESISFLNYLLNSIKASLFILVLVIVLGVPISYMLNAIFNREKKEKEEKQQVNLN